MEIIAQIYGLEKRSGNGGRGKYYKLRLTVKFENDRLKVRILNSWRIWEYFLAVKDKRGVIPYPYHNIHVKYLDDTNLHSKQKRNWLAAICNNGMHEFYDYGPPQGIDAPDKIHVLTTTLFSNAGDGSAPMFRTSGWVSILPDYLEGQLFGQSISLPNVLNTVSRSLFDVAIVLRNVKTDRIRSLIYHEYAHASHYKKVGKYNWGKVVTHEVLHGGYGTPGNFIPGVADPGKVALVESWGTHLGHSFAHLKYDLNSSFNRPASNTWLTDLENITLLNAYIPEGLYLDLLDNTPGEEIVISSSGIYDEVRGFTNGQFYQELNSLNPTAFRNRIKIEYLGQTPNNASQVDVLFGEYGY